MSTEQVAREIERFLSSDRAEVLCIRGRWGVGKTFAWRRYLGATRDAGLLAPQAYAYVSLFGLNSLDDLRYAIFESTVSIEHALTGPTPETFGDLASKGKALGRKTASWLGPALSLVGAGDLGSALSKSAFLLVRNQLVCLDDLERAGDGLNPRDVLGLASFLKEQRNCRVVLLLNDEAMADEPRAEFHRLLEKVIDVSLVFAPTASEASVIALPGNSRVVEQLRRNVETLGITNIRVIKKIERLAYMLAAELETYRSEVLTQAITTCVLGGWAVFEPDQSPPLEFIRTYNGFLLAVQDGDNEPTAEVQRWRDTLANISFSHADEFDRLILSGVSVGYFDKAALSERAKELDDQWRRQRTTNSFKEAWERYHHSLAEEDDVVIDGIRQAAFENIAVADATNINATIYLLREFSRDDEADELAEAYVASRPNEHAAFDLDEYHFMPDQPVDGALRAAFQRRYDAFEDTRDPKQVLLEIAQGNGWNTADERLMATLSADAFEALIEGTTGPDLRRVVKTALRMASHGGDSAPRMRAALHEALARIATKSPLRARRLRYWGFSGPVRNAEARGLPDQV